MDAVRRFEGWSHESLVDRIVALEAAVSRENARRSWGNGPTPPAEGVNGSATATVNGRAGKSKELKKPRDFDVAAQPCRKIALRFSYDGAPYAGLAAQSTHGDDPPPGSSSADASTSTSMTAPLPTVEGQLWRALCEARLVDAEGGMEGAGWTRCGRTDRGVSAAGQVVSLWVRSRRVDEWPQRREQRLIFLRKSGRDDEASQLEKQWELEEEQRQREQQTAPTQQPDGESSQPAAPPAPVLTPAADELPYVATLNRILPPSIRVQAWSPVRPDFSARFDCRYRHYKYFFTSGAPRSLLPVHADGAAAPGANHAGSQLDLDAMRDGAARLLGEHDFRNLCKIDFSKQIDNFRRRVDGVSIDRVGRAWPTSKDEQADFQNPGQPSDGQEEMYVLNLRGTAFLYHQVRHIVAVLFMVGARLEAPTVVDELLNITEGALVADRLALRARGILAGVDAPRDSPLRCMLPDSTATGMGGKTAADTERDELAAAASGAVEPQVELAAASQHDVDELTEHYQSLAVLDSKPTYEMAADRPLVLWDCGFKAEDVQWRASPSDAWPLDAGSEAARAIAQSRDRTAAGTTMHLHSQWVRAAIHAEMKRHFVLAAPTAASGGILPASTLFEDARQPILTAPAVAAGHAAGKAARIALPLGDGTSRSGAPGYTVLRQRKREETAAQKNERWLLGKGKRRADARGVTAIELAKGKAFAAKAAQPQPQPQGSGAPERVDGASTGESVA